MLLSCFHLLPQTYTRCPEAQQGKQLREWSPAFLLGCFSDNKVFFASKKIQNFKMWSVPWRWPPILVLYRLTEVQEIKWFNKSNAGNFWIQGRIQWTLCSTYGGLMLNIYPIFLYCGDWKLVSVLPRLPCRQGSGGDLGSTSQVHLPLWGTGCTSAALFPPLSLSKTTIKTFAFFVGVLAKVPPFKDLSMMSS